MVGSVQHGLYPSILKNLFAQRKEIQTHIAHLRHQTGASEFEISLLEAKQGALKIYMNTFYGEAGNRKSPFFDLIVAGGTTALGRKYIV